MAESDMNRNLLPGLVALREGLIDAPTLVAVEEPENQLYPELLLELVEEFRDYARRSGQVFISTHSPDFLNGTKLEEIYWLVKEGGFATVRRAADSELLRQLIEAGDLPGSLWKQGLFEGVGLR